MMFHFKLVTVLLFLAFSLNPTKGYGFWEGPNGYTYTESELKSHIESATSRASSEFNPLICSTEKYSKFMAELEKYRPVVNQIVSAVVNGAHKGTTYPQLVNFLDRFGSRLSGSQALENSIDYLQERFGESNGFDEVWTETVTVPRWERGEEFANLILPGKKPLPILSLGQSVGTGGNVLTAEAVVFNNYSSLVSNINRVTGKIVVCNYVGVEGDILDTRSTGYPELASGGALAVLYKSAATFSLSTPHTRRVNLYYNGVCKEIPIAYMTTEDANMLSRIYGRGQRLEIELQITNKNHDSLTQSRNLFGLMKGSDPKNEEHIIVSAHTDSWDVGQGAQDDGVGVYLVMQTMNLLSDLKLRPKRDIRAILWTAEEYGFNGSISYIEQHRELVMNKLVLAMEADYACLANAGFVFNADYAGKLRQHNEFTHTELGCLMHGINGMIGGNVTIGLNYQSTSFGTDLDRFTLLEVPVVSLLGDDGRYFWYHHTEADVVTALDTTQIDYCLASWTTATYILADFQNPSNSNALTLHCVSMNNLFVALLICCTLYFNRFL